MNPVKDPVRPINREFLLGLELLDTKMYPLPGATGRRQDPTQADPRLSGLKDTTLPGEEITYYEAIASVRHKPTSTFFVVFRETMDAFLARQKDTGKFPEWLMKSPEKQTERNIYIYFVKCHPKTVPILRSHEDWLGPIDNEVTFDTLAYFLHQQNVIDAKIYSSLGR